MSNAQNDYARPEDAMRGDKTELDRLRALNAELLSALQAIIARNIIHENQPCIIQARAAIAKATGD